MRDGVREKQLPEAVLVCNFPEPTETDPGFMGIEDVTTFFHEFGHLMHAILGGQQQWAGISGLTMEQDFIEAPSEMLESLIRDPHVLTSFARHFETKEPIPEELVRRMNRASAFGRARDVRSEIAFSAISYDLYKENPDSIDVDRVADEDFRRYALARVPANTHQYASFDHLANYSSAYYTYLWDQVIAEDFFAQFDYHNPLDGPVPDRYRKSVLEPGGSMPASQLVTAFLGRAQITAGFKRWMNEEFDNPDN
jgi:thimet oligopeptidase